MTICVAAACCRLILICSLSDSYFSMRMRCFFRSCSWRRLWSCSTTCYSFIATSPKVYSISYNFELIFISDRGVYFSPSMSTIQLSAVFRGQGAFGRGIGLFVTCRWPLAISLYPCISSVLNLIKARLTSSRLVLVLVISWIILSRLYVYEFSGTRIMNYFIPAIQQEKYDSRAMPDKGSFVLPANFSSGLKICCVVFRLFFSLLLVN